MKNNRVLIIMENFKTAKFMKSGLEENGFIVEASLNGLNGKNVALESKFDLLIIDDEITDLNPHSICKQVMDKMHTPWLMITKKSPLFNSGDTTSPWSDYLVKPFEFNHLLDKIRKLTSAIEKS